MYSQTSLVVHILESKGQSRKNLMPQTWPGSPRHSFTRRQRPTQTCVPGCSAQIEDMRKGCLAPTCSDNTLLCDVCARTLAFNSQHLSQQIEGLMSLAKAKSKTLRKVRRNLEKGSSQNDIVWRFWKVFERL